MQVRELSREQIEELKQTFYYDNNGECQLYYVGGWEIPDDYIFEWYAGIDFVNDDFWCTAGQE